MARVVALVAGISGQTAAAFLKEMTTASSCLLAADLQLDFFEYLGWRWVDEKRADNLPKRITIQQVTGTSLEREFSISCNVALGEQKPSHKHIQPCAGPRSAIPFNSAPSRRQRACRLF